LQHLTTPGKLAPVHCRPSSGSAPSPGAQAEKYGGRIGYEAAPAAQPAQPGVAAPPSASASGAPDVGAGAAAGDGAPAGPGTPGEAKAPPGGPGAPARASAAEPPQARSASPAPNQPPARAPAQQAVAFEERDQVDRLQALRLGEPVDFVLVPGGPGRRPRATQARAPARAAPGRLSPVLCATCQRVQTRARLPVPGRAMCWRAAVRAKFAGVGKGAKGAGRSLRL
jgi:hypothetical protein